jgi:predicted RNA binding protein YcfA (HicA-like mRNA interferase family)
MIRALERDGWIVARQRGSHVHLRQPQHPLVISVPVHNRDLKPGIVAGILHDADISVEQFVELPKSWTSPYSPPASGLHASPPSILA